MSELEERKRRGQEIIKKYRSSGATDIYTCATDVITDILLFVAQSEDEGTQILQSAEMDFKLASEKERFFSEG